MAVVSPDHHARFEREDLHSEQSCPHHPPDDHVALLGVVAEGPVKPEGTRHSRSALLGVWRRTALTA
jgi:hypothetical protein